MRFATANIMALPKMTIKEVRADVTEVAHHADVIGWGEVYLGYYVDEVRALYGFDHYGLEEGHDYGGTPISWRKGKFRLIEAGSILLHPATATICAERRVNWVLLQKRSRLPWRRKRFYFTNRHYLPKAWNGKEDPNEDLRKKMWIEGNTADRDLCAALASKGLPVVGAGDYNRPNAQVMGKTLSGRGVRYPTGRGIDYVWFVNGSRQKWRLGGTEHIAINSDHDAKVQEAHL